jgi:putative hemolysin
MSSTFWMTTGFALAFCLLLVALLAASEAALAATNRVRLRHLLQTQAAQAHSPDDNAHLLPGELSSDAQRYIATVTIAANLPLMVAAALVCRALALQWGSDIKTVVASALAAMISVSVFQITPRLLVSRPGSARLWWLRPARLLVALLRPPVAVLLFVGALLLRPLGLAARRNANRRNAKTEEQGEDEESVALAVGSTPEIRDLVESARESGALEESGKELIESIFAFGDTRVHEVMLPRPDILALPGDADANRVLDTLQESGFSRLPIHEGNVDQIIGVLHAKDVLRALARGEGEFRARDLMRPALFLPESLNINEALSRMRATRTHLAIVMDEYGGTAGLLTVEDVLEELVGEIADEHDRKVDNPLQILDDNSALAEATLHADDLLEEWDLPLPTGEFDTVGGFVIEQLGRAPVLGDKVETPLATLTVQSVRGRRPQKILIQKREKAEG